MFALFEGFEVGRRNKESFDDSLGVFAREESCLVSAEGVSRQIELVRQLHLLYPALPVLYQPLVDVFRLTPVHKTHAVPRIAAETQVVEHDNSVVFAQFRQNGSEVTRSSAEAVGKHKGVLLNAELNAVVVCLDLSGLVDDCGPYLVGGAIFHLYSDEKLLGNGYAGLAVNAFFQISDALLKGQARQTASHLIIN